jgi:hypothetical protein
MIFRQGLPITCWAQLRLRNRQFERQLSVMKLVPFVILRTGGLLALMLCRRAMEYICDIWVVNPNRNTQLVKPKLDTYQNPSQKQGETCD